MIGGTALCKEAVAIGRRIAEPRDANDSDRLLFARAHYALGLVHYAAARLDQALESFSNARSVELALVNAHPNVQDYQRELASTERDIGFTLRLTGHPVERWPHTSVPACSSKN